MKNLYKTEKVHIGEHDYVLSAIPALHAQRMLMRAFGAFSAGNIADLPEDIILEMLSYVAVINQNGAEVQLENEELVEMFIDDTMELIEVEARMVAKNFDFFGNGKLKKVLDPLTKIFLTQDGQST